MDTCTQCDTLMPGDSRFCPRCGTPAPGAPTEELLASAASDPTGLLDRLRAATEGEFRIIRELGRGGMGRVYLAHEVSLDRHVAMKVLPPAFAGHEGIVQRFQREARTAGKLSHPNIVSVYQVSKRGDITFFTMPCVVGPSLRQVLRKTPQLSFELARRYLSEAASALGYAHRQGVIHRDIKPENMLLEGSRDGRLLLTDFGIAKALGIGTTLTRPGDVMGTPYYMSPEQCEENEVDGRSDQYSLGLVAYEMLAGQFPFTADSMAGIVYKHLHEDPEPLENLRPDLPEGLRSILVRAIQKKPDARFPTMTALIEALGASATARSTVVPSVAQAAVGGAPGRRGRRRWSLVAGIGVVALGAGAAVVWQGQASAPGLGDVQLAEINVPPAVAGVDSAADALPETPVNGSAEPAAGFDDGEAATDAGEGRERAEPPQVAGDQPTAGGAGGPADPEADRDRANAQKLRQELGVRAEEAGRARTAALEAGADARYPAEFNVINQEFNRAHRARRAGRPFAALTGFAQVTTRFEALADRARQAAEQAADGPAAGGATTPAESDRDGNTRTADGAEAAPAEPRPEDAIALLLESYRRALEAEDSLALAKDIFRGPIPPENAKALRNIFRSADEFSVVLERRKLDVTGNRAEAVFGQTMNYRLASNRAKRTTKFTVRAIFERDPDGWRMKRFDWR